MPTERSATTHTKERARLGMALTAVLHQKAHEFADRFKTGAIDEPASLTAVLDQVRMPQGIQVKGERRGSQSQPFADLAGRHAVGAFAHEQTEHVQPALLGQSIQSLDRHINFHISNNMEI